MKKKVIEASIVIGALGAIVFNLDKLKDYFDKEIVFGKKTEKVIRVDIPPMFISTTLPNIANPEGIKQNFIPNITRQGKNWVVNFKKMRIVKDGIEIEYTPSPVTLPDNISYLDLVKQLTPDVQLSTKPLGFWVKFKRLNFYVK